MAKLPRERERKRTETRERQREMNHAIDFRAYVIE